MSNAVVIHLYIPTLLPNNIINRIRCKHNIMCITLWRHEQWNIYVCATPDFTRERYSAETIFKRFERRSRIWTIKILFATLIITILLKWTEKTVKVTYNHMRQWRRATAENWLDPIYTRSVRGLCTYSTNKIAHQKGPGKNKGTWAWSYKFILCIHIKSYTSHFTPFSLNFLQNKTIKTNLCNSFVFSCIQILKPRSSSHILTLYIYVLLCTFHFLQNQNK